MARTMKWPLATAGWRIQWAAMTALGLVLAAVMLLPPRPAEERLNWFDEQALDQSARGRQRKARARAERSVNQFRLAELRDAAMSAAASAPSGVLTVVSLDAVPDGWTQAADSTARAQLAALGTPIRPDARLIVALATDTVTVVPGWPRTRGGAAVAWVRPDGTDGTTCIVLLRTGGRAAATVPVSRVRSSLDRLLGPCALESTLGAPGAGVDSWLARRDFRAAWRPSPTAADDGTRISMTGWRVPFSVQACARGRQDACVQSLTDSLIGTKSVWSSSIIEGIEGDDYGSNARTGLGPRETLLLADMRRELGAERFAAFWRSELAPEAAYESIAGEPLAAFVQRWTSKRYFDEGAPTAPAPRSVALALVVLAAGGAGGAGLFGRRQTRA